MIGEGKDLERIDKDTKISWSTSIAIWPTRPRDFVTVIKKVRQPDGAICLFNKATTHPDAPPRPDYVRGEIIHGLFLIKPISGRPEQCELTMVHHFNPGGHIPAWLMNWLAEIKPVSFVQRLEAVAIQYSQLSGASGKAGGKPGRGRQARRPCVARVGGVSGGSIAGLPTCGGFLPGPESVWGVWNRYGMTTALSLLVLAAAVVAVLTKRRGRSWEGFYSSTPRGYRCVPSRPDKLGESEGVFADATAVSSAVPAVTGTVAAAAAARRSHQAAGNAGAAAPAAPGVEYST
ncbi:unnamed protein product [Phaeothamnion confervicola]